MKGSEDYSQMAKKLKGKAKWQNFWYYYKWPTIGVIFVILVAVFTIRECAMQEHPDLTVDLVATGPVVAQTDDMAMQINPLDLQGRYGEQIADVNSDGKQIISVQSLYVAENPADQQGAAMLQKVDLEFVGETSSLFLFDKVNFDRFKTRDAFSPVDRFIDLSQIPEEKQVKNENGEVIAVNLKGSAALAELGVTNDDLYAAFLFVSEKAEKNPERMGQFDNAKLILEDLLK